MGMLKDLKEAASTHGGKGETIEKRIEAFKDLFDFGVTEMFYYKDLPDLKKQLKGKTIYDMIKDCFDEHINEMEKVKHL